MTDSAENNNGSVPLDDIFLLLDRLPQRVTQSNLREVLQRRVDGVTDGVIEHTLHASHQHLQSLYHSDHLPKAQQLINDGTGATLKAFFCERNVRTDLYEGKLLLACVVVTRGPLILFSVVRTFLVGIFVCRVNQFPGILWGKSERFLKTVTRQKPAT